MVKRYELRDNNHVDWPGMRFTTIERAKREFRNAVGNPGRWSLIDRETKQVIATK